MNSIFKYNNLILSVSFNSLVFYDILFYVQNLNIKK